MAGGGDAGPPGVVEEPRLRAGRWAGARGWIEDFSTAPGAQPTAFVLDRSFVGWEFGWGRAMGSRLDGRGPGNRSGAGGTAAGAPTTPFLDAVLRAAGRSSGEVKIARRRCTARCPPLQAVPVFHRHRRHRRACGTWSATVMEFTGARWCYPVPLFHPCAGLDPPGGQLGWSRGGSEAPGATKPAATSMRTGTSTTREYQRGTTPSDTLME